MFRNFIRESRRHTDRHGLATDAIVEMLEKGEVSVSRDELGPGDASLLWPSFVKDTVCFYCKACLAKCPQN